MEYADGEVVGKDTDGCLLLWNVETGRAENCGETLEQFGEANLSTEERSRL